MKYLIILVPEGQQSHDDEMVKKVQGYSENNLQKNPLNNYHPNSLLAEGNLTEKESTFRNDPEK